MSGEYPFSVVSAVGTPGFFGPKNIPNVQVFPASGIWAKPTAPAGKQIVGFIVKVVGAGAGGWSSLASVNNNAGGIGISGGSGGGTAIASFGPAALPASVAVTVGLGGAGGAQTTQNANGQIGGLAGAAGGNSSFGTLVTAAGGPAATGGGNPGGSAAAPGPGVINSQIIQGGVANGFGRGQGFAGGGTNTTGLDGSQVSPGGTFSGGNGAGANNDFAAGLIPIPARGGNSGGAQGGASVGIGPPPGGGTNGVNGAQGSGGGAVAGYQIGVFQSGQGGDGASPGQGGGGGGFAGTEFTGTAIASRGGNGANGIVVVTTLFG
jgi:hypothetical protein